MVAVVSISSIQNYVCKDNSEWKASSSCLGLEVEFTCHKSYTVIFRTPLESPQSLLFLLCSKNKLHHCMFETGTCWGKINVTWFRVQDKRLQINKLSKGRNSVNGFVRSKEYNWKNRNISPSNHGSFHTDWQKKDWIKAGYDNCQTP